MLTPTEIDQFDREGFLVLRRMTAAATCDAMCAVVRAQLQAAQPPLEFEAEVGYPGAPQSLEAPGGRTIRRLRGAFDRHELFNAWARDPRLVRSLAQLFGEPVCVTLSHHNCIMTKHPAFGTATGWHRDIRYWAFSKPDLISAWLALGDETEENGALRVIPGSHRLQLQAGQLDALDFLRPDEPANQTLFAQGITVELQQGDVLLFHSGLFHAAGRNLSQDVKMSLVFAYHGVSNAALPGSKSAAAGQVSLGS
jgi:phytanoyl-CoA hydroxylase